MQPRLRRKRESQEKEKENAGAALNRRSVMGLSESLRGSCGPLEQIQRVEYGSITSRHVASRVASSYGRDLHVYSSQRAVVPAASVLCPLSMQFLDTYSCADAVCKSAQGSFMSGHNIEQCMRARMLDWMVEVMCSYRYSSRTYFSGVEILDRFFEACPQQLSPGKLHVLGVGAMVIASKLHEVYPFKLKTVFEKIGHKKISMAELSAVENEILTALEFNLESNTVYDLAMNELTSLFHRQTVDSIAPSKARISAEKVEKTVSFVAKHVAYDYALLCVHDPKSLAEAVVQVSLKVLQLRKFGCRTSHSGVAGEILHSMRGFKSTFKGLQNIIRFSDSKVVAEVESLVLNSATRSPLSDTLMI